MQDDSGPLCKKDIFVKFTGSESTHAGLSGARAIAQALTGMKQLEYALVYPSDVGGEEGMSIIEEAVVATFGRERATSVLLGDPHRACSMWIAGLH